MDILEFRKEGIYCRSGDFFIDPVLPVNKAVITHAHSDHARRGMNHYFCHSKSREVLKQRLGQKISVETMGYGKSVRMGAATISFHPSGHLPGASQVRVEVGGQVWVASGDYKTEADGLAEEFESVACHTFISECTFGLPVFNWKPQPEVFNQIENWWNENAEYDHTSIIFAYSLGKAQRIIHQLANKGIISAHPGILQTNDALMKDGVTLPKLPEIESLSPDELRKSLIILPQSPGYKAFIPNLGQHETAACSGWMAIPEYRKTGNTDRGFVLSDHADWKGLLKAIGETGAEKVLVNHGYTKSFSRFLRENGLNAFPAGTGEQNQAAPGFEED
jgi:putative mRNA 3-end processing factor